MNINEILKTGVNLTVSIGINDLIEWHSEVVEDTLRKLEDIVIRGKAEKYLTSKEVCAKLRIDPVTLWRWRKKGYLVPVKVGGSPRYKDSQLNEILEGGSKK